MTYDLIIIGGGPAGLATSIFAAQNGLTVIVIEKRRLPLDKACGEGLMPRGTRMLQEMGVTIECGEFFPFAGIRYIDGETAAEGRFGAEPGWGIRRTKLVGRMHLRAQELGVTLLYGVSTKGWRVAEDRKVLVDIDDGRLESRFLAGADGLHSKVRRAAELDRPSGGLLRYGIRRHFEVEPWSSFVEVYWSKGVEAYVTPVGTKEVGVALLWNGGSAGFERLLDRFPRLKNRLQGVSYSSRARAAGPFRQFASRRYRGPVALVGDAAGYLDALTGEGLSLSFLSARALAKALADEGRLNNYERDYRRLSRNYYWFTDLLLQMAQRPRLRSRVIEALARDPSLFDSLLAVSTAEKSIGYKGARSMISLMLALTRSI